MKRKCVAPKWIAGMLTLALCLQPVDGYALTPVLAEELWGGEPVAEAIETDISAELEADLPEEISVEADEEADIPANLKSEDVPDIPANLKSEDVPDIALDSYVPAGIVPKTTWNEEQWKIYKRGVDQRLSVSENNCKIYYIALDGEPMPEDFVFYHATSYPNSSSTFAEDLTEVPRSDVYPGCFIFEKEKIPSNTMYFLYKADETDITKYIKLVYSWSDFTFLMDETPVAERNLYTVSFEQGDVDTKQLPDTQYYWSGEELGTVSGEKLNFGGDYNSYRYYLSEYYNSGFYAAGYGLKGWKDQDGKEYENRFSQSLVTKPLILQPVYINEQDMELSSSITKYEITTAKEFLEKLSTLGKSMLIIKEGSNLVVDPEAVTEAFPEHTGSNAWFYWGEPMVIVEKDATLTFDNVQSRISYLGTSNYLSALVIQDGGEVIMKNGASAYDPGNDSGLFLSLQKEATLTLDDCSGWSLYGLCNHGTVRSVKPEAEESSSVSRTCLQVSSDFFNAAEGTIQMDWAKIKVENDTEKIVDRKMYDRYSEEDFVTCFIPNVNRGIILLKDDGGMELSGTSSSYQHDRLLHIPFMNQGKILCQSAPRKGFYGSPLEVEYSALQNMAGGEIRIEQPQHTPEYGSSAHDFATSSTPGMDIYSSVFINEGSFSVKAVSGLGVRLDGKYFDPADYANQYGEPLTTEVQWARIANRKGGTISLLSGENCVAMSVRSKCVLQNDGTLTIQESDDTAKLNNFTLYNEGSIENTGSIVNNNAIAWQYSYDTDDMLKFTGNPYTGSGTDCYFYYLIAEDTEGYQIAGKTSVDVYVDDVKLGTMENYSSASAYFPQNATFKVEMKAEGYQDTSVTFTTAKTFDEYNGKDESGSRNYNFKVVMKAKEGGSGTGSGGTGTGSGESGESGEAGESGGSGTGSGGSGSGSSGSGTGSGGSGSGNGSGSGTGSSGTGGSGSTGDGGSAGGSGDAGTETELPKEGKVLDDKKSGATYVVTESGKADGNAVSGAEVQFSAADKKAKTASVPATVKVDNVTYKVTSIKKNAFKNSKSLTKVTVGTNIKQIGKSAFAGCKKLKTITINSKKITKIDKDAFKGIHKNATIKVPKAQKKKYTQLLRKAGYKGKIK